MTKKERVLSAIALQPVDHTPCGFSLHFPQDCNSGEAGIQAHLDFFRETDTDILKIMNENLVPNYGTIQSPADWSCIGKIDQNTPFIHTQLEFTKEILSRCEPDGFTMGTLHGITASSIHPIEPVYGYEPVRTLLTEHLRENPQPVLDAMSRIAEGMCCLARGYAEAGVDAVYYAALGAERKWFTAEEFEKWIAPFDKLILSEIQKSGCKAFLHICKDGLDMDRYADYASFCDVVNWGIYEVPYPVEDARKLFPNKAIMGGLANRSGVMVDGTLDELAQAAKDTVARYGQTGFILGADCTLPTEIDYKRIRAIVDALR